MSLYEVIKVGCGKSGGLYYPVGKQVEVDDDYAVHLVARGILKPVEVSKPKVVRKTKVSRKETAELQPPAMETAE